MKKEFKKFRGVAGVQERIGLRPVVLNSGRLGRALSSPIADGLNAATKYVATHCPESLEWGSFESLGPDIVEGIRRIKSQASGVPPRL